MSELARSMVAVSSEARYMRVVASDECPIPSLITLIATPFRYATRGPAVARHIHCEVQRKVHTSCNSVETGVDA